MLTWLQRCTHKWWMLQGQLFQLEEKIMATFDELKAKIEQVNTGLADVATSAADANARLDTVNTKIDELRALVANGGVVNQAQLDELSSLVDASVTTLSSLATNLQEISADIADAEQS